MSNSLLSDVSSNTAANHSEIAEDDGDKDDAHDVHENLLTTEERKINNIAAQESNPLPVGDSLMLLQQAESIPVA